VLPMRSRWPESLGSARVGEGVQLSAAARARPGELTTAAADEIELNQSSGPMASLPQPPRALTGVRPDGLSSYHRSDIGMGEPASSSRPVRSEVVAGVGDLYDSSNVLLSPCHALHLLDHLLALTRPRGEE
jgi:hypothetical protein